MSFRLRNNGPIWLGEFTALTEAGFSNGCSCRLHGASSIVPDGFNLALHVGDEAELVNANRRQFAAALGVDAARFTTCAQVHGSKVVCVTEGLIGSGAVDFADTIADTDALITDLQNVPLLLFYADAYRFCWLIQKPGLWDWRMQAGAAVWRRSPSKRCR